MNKKGRNFWNELTSRWVESWTFVLFLPFSGFSNLQTAFDSNGKYLKIYTPILCIYIPKLDWEWIRTLRNQVNCALRKDNHRSQKQRSRNESKQVHQKFTEFCKINSDGTSSPNEELSEDLESTWFRRHASTRIFVRTPVWKSDL